MSSKDGASVSEEEAEEERPLLLPYASVVHGENARVEDGADAFFVFKVATTYRGASCACLGLVNLLWFVLTLGLGLAGLNPINTDNIGEVGLNVPEGVYQRRANGYETAMEEADASLFPGKCPREDTADPIEFTVMKGSMLRENRGNALQKSGLELLRRRENQVLDESGWEFRCATVYATAFPGCSKDLGTAYATGWFNTTYKAATDKGCMRPFSPVYYFERYGDANFDDIPGTVLRIKETSASDWRSFTDMLHKDFTVNNMRSKILKSSIYAGTPRRNTSEYVSQAKFERIKKGFSISFYNNKETEEEFDHLSGWIRDNLGDDFADNAKKTPYRTLFSYADYNPVEDQVILDLSLLVVSVGAVVLYMWYYTGSLFVTAAGMFQIFMSFFGANLIYRYCWPTPSGLGYNYFTLFCALALFVIMGIGADDIFVYWDTWNGSATHPYKSVAHRMSHVYGHACSAMLVTSLTTVLSFVANLSSPFVGIRTFGVFSALLVFVNYCAVVTFFPCVVLAYDKYVKDMEYVWTPLWVRLAAFFATLRAPGGTEAQVSEEEAKPSQKNNGDIEIQKKKEATKSAASMTSGDDDDDEEADDEDPLPKWFRTTYASFVIKYKILVLAAFAAAWVAFVVLASMLVVAPFQEHELLPVTTNYHQFTFISQNWFPKSQDPKQVHLIFGLDHRDPVSYNGVSDYRFVPGESGDPNFDESFDLDSPAAQNQLLRTAFDLAMNPPAGLKIDSAFGINPQLAASATGSLEDTPDGGATSTVQTPTGIQSLFHALQQWENVTARDPATGEYQVRSSFPSSCRPCFASFFLDPDPLNASRVTSDFVDRETGVAVEDIELSATSDLSDGCNCVGAFPVPNSVCLHETRAAADDTLYKCAEQNNQLAFQLDGFFRAGGQTVDISWWDDYVFASADSLGRFTNMALYDIQVQTVLRDSEKDLVLGLRMADEWDDWMDDYNKNPDYPLKVMVHVPGAADWYMNSLLVPSGIQNMLISLLLAWIVLTLSTFNYAISTLATVTIGMITTEVLGFIHILGWGLGPLESILIVIVIGFSVDYTVHLADSYIGSSSHSREGKVRDALGHTGSSVLSGALSTLGAAIPMFGAQIVFFVKFGAFVFMTIALSLVHSLGFFATLLVVLGPLGKQGHLANFYGGCVAAAHDHVHELEEEQALVDQEKRNGHVSASVLSVSLVSEEDKENQHDDDDEVLTGDEEV